MNSAMLMAITCIPRLRAMQPLTRGQTTLPVERASMRALLGKGPGFVVVLLGASLCATRA